MEKRKLKITNVGPITGTVDIEYGQVCVLIGPQSNGKSTIAKIMSTCMWLEKEACTSLKENVIDSGQAFRNLIEDFHRMHGYIHADSSSISYESKYVIINYDKDDFELKFKDVESYHRIKISYIPSDRNVITMNEIEKRELEHTNFRSFLFDWLAARKYYNKENKIPILNLGMQYYYDAQLTMRQDRLTHENGVTYDIPLYDASSGMQSMVPLMVLMHYLLTNYFDTYNKEISFEQKEENIELSWAIVKKILTEHFPNDINDTNYREYFNKNVRSKNEQGDAEAKSLIEEMRVFYNQLIQPESIAFVLEEPEQNLYPETQVKLLNDIICNCNKEHPSTLLITTHSPYILAAANVLLFAGKMLSHGIKMDKIKDIVDVNSIIKEDELTAYSVSGGLCVSLLDDKTNLIRENELDSASEYNAGVFSKLYEIFTKELQGK